MKNQLQVFGIALLSLVLNPFVVFGQIPSAEMRIRSFKVKDANIVETLNSLSIENNLPVALRLKTETSGIDNFSTTNIRLRRTTLRAVCDAIVKAFPDYEWTIASGVLRFGPKIRSDALSDLLSQEINAFELNGKVPYPRLRWKIFSISEVCTILKKHNLTSDTVEMRIVFGQDLPSFSINMEKATLSDILDAVVTQGTRKMWVIFEKADRSVVLSFI
ncbi:MAG: hypothetical protein IPJ30_01670 [Acidobacteria bacterium]|nr:hypothetical protein [Acidobacteriota bacterium]